MNVYLGADHRGFKLKEELKPWLMSEGYEVVDCGNAVLDPGDDYPDFSFTVADKVAGNPGSLGIIVCGSGGGATFAANKVKGIRCVTGIAVEDVRHNRDHSNINVLSLAADFTDTEKAKELVKTFLTTPYTPEERFARRLKKIEEREA